MNGIEFKAFDKNKKKIFDVTYIDFANERLDIPENIGEPYSIDRFELLLFTGLRDVRGVKAFRCDTINEYQNGKLVAKGFIYWCDEDMRFKVDLNTRGKYDFSPKRYSEFTGLTFQVTGNKLLNSIGESK